MARRIAQYASIAAVASLLAYLGAASVPPMRYFAPAPASLGLVLLAAALAGLLLAFVTDQAPLSVVIAVILALLLFAGIRAVTVGMALRRLISVGVFELISSDAVLLYTLQRGLIMYFAAGLLGLIGSVAGLLLIPQRYRS